MSGSGPAQYSAVKQNEMNYLSQNGLPDRIEFIKITKSPEIMKKCWALFIPLFLMSLNFSAFWLSAQPVRLTGKKARSLRISPSEEARLLAEIFVLSNPLSDPNELVSFVLSKPYYFNENGPVTLAASELGSWILEHDMKGFDADCLSRIQNQLKKNNIPEAYAEKLLSDLKSGKIDCRIIGREFIWLSEILPAISKGDLNAYLNTGIETRKELENMKPVRRVMHNSDPEIAELILDDKYCFYQQLADRIQILALISNTEE